MTNQNWNIATNSLDYLQQTEKRLGFEERRLRVSKASDLLGPLSGPSAVTLMESLASDALAFNGLFVVPPGTPESPDAALWWLGESIAQDGVGGLQILYTFRVADAPRRSAIRTWETVPASGGLRSYSTWEIHPVVPVDAVGKFDSGQSFITTVGGANANTTVAFNKTFASPPHVVCIPRTSSASLVQMTIGNGVTSTTDFVAYMYRTSGSGDVNFDWIAVSS